MKIIKVLLFVFISATFIHSQDEFDQFMVLIQNGYRPFLEDYTLFEGWIDINERHSYIGYFNIKSGDSSSVVARNIKQFEKTGKFYDLEGNISTTTNSSNYKYIDLNGDDDGMIILMCKSNDRGFLKYSGLFYDKHRTYNGVYPSIDSIHRMIMKIPFKDGRVMNFDIFEVKNGFLLYEKSDIIKVLPPKDHYRSLNDILTIYAHGLDPSNEICKVQPPNKIYIIEMSFECGKLLTSRFLDIDNFDNGMIRMNKSPALTQLPVVKPQKIYSINDDVRYDDFYVKIN